MAGRDSGMMPIFLKKSLKVGYFHLNPAQGGASIQPHLRFLLVKKLFIDIFAIPSVRIREIVFAIRISNNIWRFFR